MKAFNEAPGRNQLVIRAVEKAIELDTEHYFAFVTRRLDKGKWVTGGLMDRFGERAKLACAQNLERVGRPLDAAIGYEQLKMYDKAKELREKEKQVIVKGTNVSLDLNRFLQQIKDGGIVAVFRCPHCGGKLKVDKNVDVAKLKVCEHCGSEIESMDLADFLKTALS
jgi:transcription initiation factor IIE alpha subunit